MRGLIALERILKIGLGPGLLRVQVGPIAIAGALLPVNRVQLTLELGDFFFLRHRLFQKLARRGQGHVHFIDRHVFDQLERQQANQR